MTAIEQAKAYALEITGLSWDRRDKWSDADRVAYLEANAQFRRDNPLLFTEAELAAGVNYQAAADAPPPPKPNLVSEFFREAGAQVERINPFSELNLPGFARTLAAIAALGAVAYFAVLAWRTAPARNK